jgi:microsomal epoxide hydrolase
MLATWSPIGRIISIWRVQEAALNEFSQFKVPLHDIDVHYLHVRGAGPNPYPLLLLHG